MTPGHTDDPSDPRLTHGVDKEPVEQAEVYLVLREEERQRGFVRPYRDAYVHVRGAKACKTVTTMSRPLSETYAKNPNFYGSTYCCGCRMHLPVGEFDWTLDNQQVGS